MIQYKSGDILAEDAEALVNTVNCVGVMGRGIARQFKKRFPDNFKAYEVACRQGEIEPGRMFVFETGQLTNPRFVINFPTKRHWRGKTRIEDVETGLEALVEEIRIRGIRSVAVPPLGCGLGGLDWAEVRPRIERALAELPEVRVVVFEPTGAPAPGKQAKTGKVPAMTPGRAALVGLMDRYLAGLMDPFITLLEVHKLMYFMQEAGEPLNCVTSRHLTVLMRKTSATCSGPLKAITYRDMTTRVTYRTHSFSLCPAQRLTPRRPLRRTRTRVPASRQLQDWSRASRPHSAWNSCRRCTGSLPTGVPIPTTMLWHRPMPGETTSASIHGNRSFWPGASWQRRVGFAAKINDPARI